ncbi:MAG: tRNA pseudouridine(13) synthase TruD [Polyangia bacterium]|jgi:tRNA pseudouridine13 synthase
MARFIASPATFFVEEIPAYQPTGEGEHAYLWIEKRDLTTPEAASRLASVLGTPVRDVGYAGMKDRHATTKQWLSFAGVDPAVARVAAVDGVRVLAATRHKNKLRTGHLQGNRFEVVLSDAQGERSAIEVALARLAQQGVANRFGYQRFGNSGDNLATGLAVLRGTRRVADPRRRKLLLSAVQSAVFNRVLDLRQESGGLLAVRQGDVLQKVASGGLFVSTDPGVDQPRVDRGEIVPTAPLPGSRVSAPPPGTAAHALEERALAELGIGVDELGRVGRALPGTRRPVIVKITLAHPAVSEDPAGLRLAFALPAGSYATVVLLALGVECSRPLQPVLPSGTAPVARPEDETCTSLNTF